MKRRYNRDLFAGRVKRIREKIPLAGIGADVIVGFPGETDSDFEDTYNFIDTLPLSYLHVFPFSERPGTVAVNLPGKVTHNQKESRVKRLLSLSENKALEFRRLNTGETAEVLFEKVNTGGMIPGFTGNYIRTEYPWNSTLEGQVKRVRLLDIAPSGNMNIELV
jgi:threonylcarbamoyladenosine tRNA methylthiotransferase MtaB